MGEHSHIEWTDHTFNPWWGCMKVSDGCKNCYADTLDNRYHHNNRHWGPNSPRKPMSEAYWRQPFKWDEDARKSGIKAKVFCASMADVFEDHPDVIEWRLRLFRVIENTPNLIWQLLTKRPENIRNYVPGKWLLETWPPNVWIGTSVENQSVADERILRLLEVHAKVHFISCEPLLGMLDIAKWLKPVQCQYVDNPREGYSLPPVNWVICGGESGPKARPMHPDWARLLRDQCKAAGVPYFFKQWGAYLAISQMNENQINEIDTAALDKLHDRNKINLELDPYYSLCNMGKHWTGSLLDNVEHKEFPAF